MAILNCLVLILAGVSGVENSGRKVEMKASAERVGKYEKLELVIGVGMEYGDPFDPDEVETPALGNESSVAHGRHATPVRSTVPSLDTKDAPGWYREGHGTLCTRQHP